MTGGGVGDFGAPEPGDAGLGQKERREVFYAGHVQGVGFRYTTRSIATQLPVVGLVRNLPDGRVHLVVEGSPEAIDAIACPGGSRVGPLHPWEGSHGATGDRRVFDRSKWPDDNRQNRARGGEHSAGSIA